MAFKKKEAEEVKPESKQEPAQKEGARVLDMSELVNHINLISSEVVRLREDLDWLLRTLVTQPQIVQSVKPEEVDFGIKMVEPKKFEDVPEAEPVVEQKMKVEMLKSFSAGDKTYKVGEAVEVSQSFADTLIKSGLGKIKS